MPARQTAQRNTTAGCLTIRTRRGVRHIAYMKSDPRANGATQSRPPGLLFLPGFHSVMTGVKANMLAQFAADIGIACTRFDYYGHGASSGEPAEGTIGRWLRDSREIFQRLTSGPQILVGSSMGGWLALRLAHDLNRHGPSDHARRIMGLVLLAPALDMTERLIRRRLDKAARRQLKRDGVLRYQGAYDDAPYHITHKLLKRGRKYCFNTRPINITCPVHILHGQQDPDIPWQDSLELLEQLESPQARLTLIKDGDHRLSRPADLALLRDAIMRLLADTGARDYGTCQPGSKSSRSSVERDASDGAPKPE